MGIGMKNFMFSLGEIITLRWSRPMHQKELLTNKKNVFDFNQWVALNSYSCLLTVHLVIRCEGYM